MELLQDGLSRNTWFPHLSEVTIKKASVTTLLKEKQLYYKQFDNRKYAVTRKVPIFSKDFCGGNDESYYNNLNEF